MLYNIPRSVRAYYSYLTPICTDYYVRASAPSHLVPRNERHLHMQALLDPSLAHIHVHGTHATSRLYKGVCFKLNEDHTDTAPAVQRSSGTVNEAPLAKGERHLQNFVGPSPY